MDEALSYCANDTLILTLGVLYLEAEVLRASKYEISMIWSSSFTLAGLSAIFYRHLFMGQNSIGKYQ